MTLFIRIMRTCVAVFGFGLLLSVWPVELLAGLLAFPVKACFQSEEELIQFYSRWPRNSLDSILSLWDWVCLRPCRCAEMSDRYPGVKRFFENLV